MDVLPFIIQPARPELRILLDASQIAINKRRISSRSIRVEKVQRIFVGS